MAYPLFTDDGTVNGQTCEEILNHDEIPSRIYEQKEVPYNEIDDQYGGANPVTIDNLNNVVDRTFNNSSKKEGHRPRHVDEILYDDRISLRELFIKTKIPEIEFDIMLDFSNLNHPDLAYLLMVGCQCLMGELKQIRLDCFNTFADGSYQIELRPRTKNSLYYKLLLRIDPSEWYQSYMDDTDIQSKVNDYIHRIQKECDQYEVIADSITTNARQQQPRCRPPVVCEKGYDCGFYACSDHMIYKEEGVWYAAARCSEYPVVTICPQKHFNNKQWVQTKEAWKIVCGVINKLKNDLQLTTSPVERIYINFGRWQTQSRANILKTDECHAHINIVLKSEVIDLCKSGPEHLRILQHATKHPIDHRLEDANELNRIVNGIVSDEDWFTQEATQCSELDKERDYESVFNLSHACLTFE